VCVCHADALQAGAQQFEMNATRLKRKYWWQNLKVGTAIMQRTACLSSSALWHGIFGILFCVICHIFLIYVFSVII